MKLPYGVANFYSIRTQDYLYLDRTDRIALVEDLGKSLLFLRPRRFGKSLWLSTLANYYDLRRAEEHERLFGDLAVGERPTSLAHRYFVLEWDFSDIDPNPPLGEGPRARRLGAEVHRYLLSSLEVFLARYRDHLPYPIELANDAFTSLNRVLAAVEQTPYAIYLLVDEYDNFANEVMVSDASDYHQLVRTDGPFKRLFKWVKASLQGPGLDRVFLTGVSPIVISDVTSGMNVTRSVYLKPVLADLCGFTSGEIDELIVAVLRQRGEDPALQRSPRGNGELAAPEIKLMMREWYNGYRFALRVPERVYNPTLAFYFLLHLLEEGNPPRQMLDSNLAADEGKLDYLAQIAAGHGPVAQAARDEAGRDTVIDLIRKDQPLEVRQLLDHFTLEELLEHSAQDASFLGSYLFYFGMLTLKKEETEQRTVELVVPNQVMHGLYVERIRKNLMPLGTSRAAADAVLFAFLRSGDVEPLLDFIEATLFPTFSNRDATWANELTVKTVFLTLLWNAASYIIHSEPEVDHRYADLCLLRRPDARTSSLWDLLFEFKRLSLKELGMSGKDVKAASRADLRKLPKVSKALDQADSQITAYRAALGRSRGDALKLRSFPVVALGFERLISRPAR